MDSWVNVASLEERNTVSHILQRGFSFPASGEGMQFSTGNIQLIQNAGISLSPLSLFVILQYYILISISIIKNTIGR